ncbi:hypothetical protein K7640_12765 [Micromonospora sp. PLK6-60]|uniref:hypothetical protein n=1 Tax=Micromonospora sp. PLK6-60 TaxID=2873383 RepID=UPI001CA6E15A|nr:hypothetical protein [Micromonospora sp. PLK6-60]MBY8872707.1 hypothetical protein [Micromonospora sp. PLK6-60]
MSSFDEYAALAAQLSDQLRTGERAAVEETRRLRGLTTVADQLGERLAAQAHRLEQLGRAIGVAETGPDAGTPAPAAAPPAPSPVGAGPAPSADPAAELTAVRQLADEADRHVQATEAIGRQPALLPTWSPAARALTVYCACALAGATLMLVMVLASGIGLIGGFTLGAWICAGLPVVSFVAGYLVLGRFGKAPLIAGPPPRYVPMGFVICVLLVPFVYCAYLLLVRFLR